MTRWIKTQMRSTDQPLGPAAASVTSGQSRRLGAAATGLWRSSSMGASGVRSIMTRCPLSEPARPMHVTSQGSSRRQTPPSPCPHSRFASASRRRYDACLDRLPPGLPTPDAWPVLWRRCRPKARDRSLRCALRQLVLRRALNSTGRAGADGRHHPRDEPRWPNSRSTGLWHWRRTSSTTCTVDREGPDGARAQPVDRRHGQARRRELNVSSDIDLIYVYDQDGETAGNAEGRHRFQP